MLRVVQCARDVDSCTRPGASEPAPGEGYLVAAGSGRGTLRTREQALTDVYQELRDRTQFGSHLVVRPLRLPVPEAGMLPTGGEGSPGKPRGGEPLIAAAFRAMATVDAEGGVTVDEDHAPGNCRVTIAEGDADAGVSSCAFEDESHSRGIGPRR
jgi:hypothetical protein